MGHAFTVERSARVNASAQNVFAHVNNFHEWKKWSPWEAIDPNLTCTFSGPETGVGAAYSWSGNRKAGAGSMVITESMPHERMTLELAFERPFKAENVVTFHFSTENDLTTVRWQMLGERNLFLRLVSFIVPMDKIVGKDFEKGLSALKRESETRIS